MTNRFLTLIGFLLLNLAPTLGQAQGGVRDAEIEDGLRKLMEPIFYAAGLQSRNVDFYLVKDDRLNAFVTGGANIYMNTGTLEKANSIEQIIGVLAHEIGHISGGHLIRTQERIRQARIQSAIISIAGLGAAVAAGRSDIAVASQSIALGSVGTTVNAYTRTQESAADQAGANFMRSLNLPPNGMIDFLKVIESQSFFTAQRRPPYATSHPLGRDRIAALETLAQQSPHQGQRASVSSQQFFERVRAKLIAFTKPYETTLGRYPVSDTSFAARYARAIAAYRFQNISQALALLDPLIQEQPQDPYLWELRAQMLLENGYLNDAHEAYAQAVNLSPDTALFRAALAHTQLEIRQPEYLSYASSNIDAAVQKEPKNYGFWRLKSRIHGQQNQIGEASLAIAESALITRNKSSATQQAKRASQLLPAGSPGQLRAQDIIRAAARIKSK